MKKFLTSLGFLFTLYLNFSVKAQWQLTGNSIVSTNFIGSTNSQPLVFKVNNQKSGLIDYSLTKANTSFGYQALMSVANGADNLGLGYNALKSDSSGSNNVAAGNRALANNTTGNINVAVGTEALYHNTTASANTAIGYNSIFTNTGTGYNLTGIGVNTLFSNTTGYENTAAGVNALYSNTSGHKNTATGVHALFSNTAGHQNTACGYYTLVTNTTGDFLTAVGYQADVNNTNYQNTTVVGNGALGTASNQVRIGNSSVTSIGGYQAWTNLSDGRIKKNIKQEVPGLKFINKLKPVVYNFDLNAADLIMKSTGMMTKSDKGLTLSQEEITARKQVESTLYTGFIAQDVENAANEINYDFSGVDKPKNDNDLYGLRYSEFVVPLVKAVQELSSKNDSLDEINHQILQAIDVLVKRVNELEKKVGSNSQSALISDRARLEQNIPNPSKNNTLIRYFIPNSVHSARILVTDLIGHTLKTVFVNNKGNGQVTLSTEAFAPGVYFYSLVVDGIKADTKQMILTH